MIKKKEKLRIVLVNPPSPFLLDQKVFPPLGLLTLSSVIKQAGYTNITFLDLAGVEKENIPLIDGDIFFFTATTPQVEHAKDIVLLYRKKNRNRVAKYIIGGPHATVSQYGLSLFDSIVMGEGEKSVLKILDSYPNIKPLYLDNPTENLDEIPFADRDVIDIKEYANNYLLDGIPTTTYVTSKGCSYGKCAFCCRTTKGVRYRSAQNIYDEIKLVQDKYGISGAMFFDDEFVSNKKRLKEFCELVAPLKIKWRCLSRISSIDAKIVPIMKGAGCVEIGLGIESADPKILKNITKGIKIDDAKKAVKLIQSWGIRVKELFIIGLPGENEESIRKVFKFVERSKPYDVDFTILGVFPGSDIHKNPENYDIKFNPKCHGWYKGIPGQYTNLCKINTSSLSFDEIVKARDELEKKFKPESKLIRKD